MRRTDKISTLVGPLTLGWHDQGIQPEFRRHEQEIPRPHGAGAACEFLPTASLVGILSGFSQCIKEGTKSFVLDAEAVAINKDTAKLMPFQELSRRKRKDVKVEDILVRVCLFGFDLLYLNGEVRNIG